MHIRIHDVHVFSTQLEGSALEVDIAWCVREHEAKVDMNNVALQSAETSPSIHCNKHAQSFWHHVSTQSCLQAYHNHDSVNMRKCYLPSDPSHCFTAQHAAKTNLCVHQNVGIVSVSNLQQIAHKAVCCQTLCKSELCRLELWRLRRKHSQEVLLECTSRRKTMFDAVYRHTIRQQLDESSSMTCRENFIWLQP
jgi:hypothetical protein